MAHIIKNSCPNFPKGAQTVVIVVLWLKSNIFKMAPKLAKHLGYFCRKFITKTFKKTNLVTQYAATFFGILLVLYISGDLDDKMISNLAAVDMVVGFNKSETKE